MTLEKKLSKKKLSVPNDIEFEIRFIEGVLKHVPDFIPGLIVLGDLYTKKKFFEKALAIDLRLSFARPDDPYILYNLACSYSLLNKLDEALSILKSAVEYGYDHFEYLQYDNDLANLRQDRRYQEFIVQLMNKKVSRSQ